MYEPFNPAEYIEKDLYNVLEAGKKAKIDQNLPLGFIIDGTQGMAKTTSASLLAKKFFSLTLMLKRK